MHRGGIENTETNRRTLIERHKQKDTNRKTKTARDIGTDRELGDER